MNENEYPQRIAVVGCGTVGSFVSYQITLFSLMKNLRELVLVDNDILEKKNLPYLFITEPESHYIGNPKIMALQYQLSSINPLLEINNCYGIYKDNKLSKSYFVIDCRDISDKQHFDLKVCCDGPYCKIIHKGSEIPENGKINSYLFENSKYFCSRAAVEVCNNIFSPERKKESYIIDFQNNIKIEL
jgi:hypothetical protein